MSDTSGDDDEPEIVIVPDEDDPPGVPPAAPAASPAVSVAASPPASPGPNAGKTYRKLTAAQWEQVVVLWELGKVTIADLVKMFGITDVAIRMGLKKRGAKKGARLHEISAAAVDAAKTDMQKQIERITSMKEKYLNYNDVISKLTIAEILEAKKAGTTLASRRDNLTALQKAAQIIARARNENYHLLGLYDENAIDDELPDIGIAEYSPEELDKIQRGFETITDDIADEEIELPDFDDGDGSL